MSNSAINTQVAQLKIGNVQNQADNSAVYSGGIWSLKNSTALTSVTITDSGNVGIGTASPTRRLHVSSGETVQLVMTSTGATSGFQGYTNAGSFPVGAMDFTSSGMIFYTGNGTSGAPERMRLDASGNVGIGTASPGQKLDIVGPEIRVSSNSGLGTRMTFTSTSTNGRTYQIGSNFTTGNGEFAVYDSTVNAERMRIESDGRLRVMAASSGGEAAIFTNSIASNPYGLTVNFSGADPNNTTQWVFRAVASATNIYTIWSNGTVTARSDIRYKQDITPARNYLADLNQLEVVNYRWKSNPDGNKELGFIAQQVESIMPGLVLTEKEGDNECKSIKVSVLTPMLVKAIQELSAKNEALEARLAALEAK